MLSFLKNHPFAVEAYFQTSIVLTFAVPQEQLLSIIPKCLELDTFSNRWAFIAVAVVKTKGLRPKGFPKFMGNDFVLAGFRVFVRYHSTAGKRQRGLFILKSETDKKKMEFLGNIFTQYNYATTDISFLQAEKHLSISSEKSDFNMELETGDVDTPLPQDSPFTNWKEARRFAGPLPFTFTYDKQTNQVLIIEGVREYWEPLPLNVLSQHIGYFQAVGMQNTKLASAFIIKDIPYYWKKGRIEQWNK